ncbi:DUF5313 family protein [Actinokineospora sp. NBRC 105648]|uniref:DUF5313 family protein n=1 Tax=Actinokineospora sp. NBRC 105648 TaxID=3032206 RepID=UPI0024A357B7|nr:DUF5313 family protein [Actinokineospora sp. NBRC 105648]GLZ39743.1 hypothetical protein Acsp05_33670 [Actinokineospora sp. NBRC 105648]
MRSPSFPVKVWYLFGGKISDEYREWVLRDAARASWGWWFAVRTLFRMLPLTVVITLGLLFGLSAPLGLSLACGSLGLIVGCYFMLSYALESTEHRMTRYGWPHGAAALARAERTRARDLQRQAAYDAVWRDSAA